MLSPKKVSDAIITLQISVCIKDQDKDTQDVSARKPEILPIARENRRVCFVKALLHPGKDCENLYLISLTILRCNGSFINNIN